MSYISDIFAFIDQYGSTCPKLESGTTVSILEVPPFTNGKKSKIATPADILSVGQDSFARSVDPSSLPLGNSWHGPRKRDHGYRGSENLTQEEF